MPSRSLNQLTVSTEYNTFDSLQMRGHEHAMFQKVNVTILGIVENMSYFTTPSGERVEIFGHGGGRAEAERQGIPFLGEVPIFTEIREGGDTGLPVVVGAPEKPAGEVFIKVAEKIRERLA